MDLGRVLGRVANPGGFWSSGRVADPDGFVSSFSGVADPGGFRSCFRQGC